MTMQEIVSRHPEWPTITQVEAWLTAVAREAGPYAESALADFGARLDDNGEAVVSHLPAADIEAIKAAALA
jgi:hypothetical protein